MFFKNFRKICCLNLPYLCTFFYLLSWSVSLDLRVNSQQLILSLFPYSLLNYSYNYLFQKFFCFSYLCFKTDQMTVVQRRDIMERQNDMADLNNDKEISLFSSLITGLGYMWQDKEVSEILSRCWG